MDVAVVIPCYRVSTQILDVIRTIPDFVSNIICIDDGCPEHTADVISEHCGDNRVTVLRHARNLGVGAAVITGYRQALELKADIIVKIDGDGQMDPGKIRQLIRPIENQRADYTKGNRFFLLHDLQSMPWIRKLGNAALSFLSKFSTGYWRIFDPTNGYTAIHRNVLAHIPFDDLHNRYFFESDLLFQLSTLRASVVDVPQTAIYGNEQSSLKITRAIPLFFGLHCRNFFRRIFYNYFLRDFHLASIYWLLGPSLLLFGLIFGIVNWHEHVANNLSTPNGTIMLATLTIILGLQLTLSAIGFDIDNQPIHPIFPLLDEDTVED